MDIIHLLAQTIELGGSDLHLKVDSPPRVRVDGVLIPLEEPLITDDDTETVLARRDAANAAQVRGLRRAPAISTPPTRRPASVASA